MNDERDGVICPRCGHPAEEKMTQYGSRHECCGLWSWGGKPLFDRATHEARKRAHAALDPVWKLGIETRGKVYRCLANEMRMSRAACHISLMTAAQANVVPKIVERKWGDALRAVSEEICNAAE